MAEEFTFRRVAVVGAGLMGHGIALEYALGGLEVALVTSRPETARRARERAAAGLERFVAAGLAAPEEAAAALARIAVAADLAAAVAAADLVVESVPEDLELKASVFRAADAAAPARAIFASNTSGLPITRLAAATRRPERVIGTHYWNPPQLMPLVEVIAGERSDPAVLAAVEGLLRRLGKVPLRVRKDVPGFVWNRLQQALLREALWLVEQGVATPEDVDLSVRLGLGRRYSVVGLFEAVDLGGLRVWSQVAANLWPELSNATDPAFLKELVARGRLGAASGGGFYDWTPERAAAAAARRDEALLAKLRAERGR